MTTDIPKPKQMYTDCDGRVLIVKSVDIGIHSGREVKGKIILGLNEYDYSCTLNTWQKTWRDREPRANLSEMNI